MDFMAARMPWGLGDSRTRHRRADGVDETGDGWTLRPRGGQPTVQYEHTMVATRNGPVVLTVAD